MPDNSMYEVYDVAELGEKDTLSQGQAEDLKVDEGGVRWWLSRCGPEDGQDFPIGVEVCIKGRWTEVHRYGDWDEWNRLDEPDDEDDEEE